MTSRRVMLPLLALIAACTCLWAQPSMPKEDIPKDMPDKVKASVRNLYSADVAERGRAAGALGQLGEVAKPGIPYLITMLGDKDDARAKVIEALGRIGEPAVVPLIDAMKIEDADSRLAAAQALGIIGKPAVGPLIASLPADTEAVRTDLAKALVLIGKPAIDALILGVASDNVHIRWGCAVALGEIGDPRGVDPLIAGLKDKDWSDRWCTARSLGQIGDARTVQPLIDAVTANDAKSWDSMSAALALRKFSDPAVPQLIAGLKNESPLVRKPLVGALGSCTTKPAVQAVVAALADPDEGVHAEAVAAVTKLKEKATDELIDKAQKSELPLRLAVIKILGDLKEKKAVRVLEADLADISPEVRAAATVALGQIGDPLPAKELRKLLTDSDPGVAAAAAGSLGELKDKKSVPILIELLKSPDPKTQQAAATALVVITGKLFDTNTYDIWHDWWLKEASK